MQQGHTHEQTMEALDRANRIRKARAAIKRAILAGDQRICDVVLDPPECMLTITLSELLRSQPRWGYDRARKCLSRDCGGMGEHKLLGTLTERQRRLLAGVLRQRNGKWNGIT